MGQADDRDDRWVRLGDLLDAEEVAKLAGLAHRNSVYTYRTRYANFPPPIKEYGRFLLWHRDDVAAWIESRRGTSSSDPAES